LNRSHGNHIYFHEKCTGPISGDILAGFRNGGGHSGSSCDVLELSLSSVPGILPGLSPRTFSPRPPVNLSLHFSFAAYFLALPLNAFLIGFKFPAEPPSKTRHKGAQNEIEFYY